MLAPLTNSAHTSDSVAPPMRRIYAIIYNSQTDMSICMKNGEKLLLQIFDGWGSFSGGGASPPEKQIGCLCKPIPRFFFDNRTLPAADIL